MKFPIIYMYFKVLRNQFARANYQSLGFRVQIQVQLLPEFLSKKKFLIFNLPFPFILHIFPIFILSINISRLKKL